MQVLAPGIYYLASSGGGSGAPCERETPFVFDAARDENDDTYIAGHPRAPDRTPSWLCIRRSLTIEAAAAGTVVLNAQRSERYFAKLQST